MKTTMAVFLIMLGSFVLKGQNPGSSVTDNILSGYSARMFTSEPVSNQEIDLILKCGIKAPSSRNGQPWRFTVVRDTALMRPIINNIVPGNILIIVSGKETGQEGMTINFDCGLATENMNIAAQSIGLGARIYGGPVGTVNSTMKQILEIPEGYRVVTILRVGHCDNSVDAISSASARKKFEEVVNYKQ
jgi:nitroreductase